MKKILVFNVAAELGGALTILQSFYSFAATYANDIHWFFVISTPDLSENDRVTIFRYPEVKKSWVNRLLFDYFKARKIVKKIAPDVIFSMQNVLIPRVNNTQVLYLHQPIPFTNIKFSLKQSKYHWIYQNLISKLIYRSIKNADRIIVQTKWMAESAAKKTGEDIGKFRIIPPDAPKINTNLPYDVIGARNTFFYPVSFIGYKNHELIINAVKILEDRGVTNFQVLFTGDYNEAEGINLDCSSRYIRLIGRLSYEEVINFLRKTTLIFPSKLETYGLPLLEARLSKAFVLAGDTPFSHEILDGYCNAGFFNLEDPEELALKMQNIINNTTKYLETFESYQNLQSSGWKPVVDVLTIY